MLSDDSGSYEVSGQHVTFAEKMPENVCSAPMQDATVYVDVHLTEELKREGYTREVIRRIQEMRRQLDLAVEDFITSEVLINDPEVFSLLNQQKVGLEIVERIIADEVRAMTPNGILFSFLKPEEKMGDHEQKTEWDVEGVQMTIGISRARN